MERIGWIGGRPREGAEALGAVEEVEVGDGLSVTIGDYWIHTAVVRVSKTILKKGMILF